MTNKQKVQVNDGIISRRVLLIDEEGKKLGQFLTRDAINMAEDKDLDLVQVSQDEIPTCKIMDHGKYLFEQKKRIKESVASSNKNKTKEVRLGSSNIADADLNVRIRKVTEFINDGCTVKVTMKFRGADLRHSNIGMDRCLVLINAVQDIATLEQKPIMAGKIINFTLIPK